MLKSVCIKNIKSINDERIDFKNLNLLVGMNSSGKSTVIQSILFAIQKVSNPDNDPLNGPLVSLGDFSEVKNYNKHIRDFSVKLNGKTGIIDITATQNDDDKVNYVVTPTCDEVLVDFNYHNRKINYLSSKRIGGQDLYSKNYENSHLFGINGEYSVHYYDTNKKNIISEHLIVESENGYTLEAQLNHWLKLILNTEIRTESIPGTDKVRLSYIHGDFEGPPRLVRPKNIGAGLSYIISILIATLSSDVGDLIIIENPEIQLHPRAQSKIIDFLSYISSKGVQLIIETHSDHIFNGVRREIAKDIIHKEDVNIYFFNMDEKMNTKIIKIDLDDNGVILNHERGLFDQFDEDLDELLGL